LTQAWEYLTQYALGEEEFVNHLAFVVGSTRENLKGI